MKISFVIPAYNAASTIDRCLESVINQTDGDWEAIIVDDGSKDDTYRILKRHEGQECRITVFRQENQGPGIARNKAMKYATGEYIAFLDADDYIEPDYVASVKKKIIEDALDVVVLDNYYETAAGKVLRMERLSDFKGLEKEDLIAVQMTGKMPWGGWRKVVKRELIRKKEIQYSCDAVGEEALFSFQVFRFAEKIGFLGQTVYHYVDYPTSQSKKGNDDPWGDAVKRLQQYLEEQSLMGQYKKQLNSFAITALVVSLYRVSIGHNFAEANAICQEKIHNFRRVYSMDVCLLSLEMRVKLLLVFIKLSWTMPIVLVSRIKSQMDKRAIDYDD